MGPGISTSGPRLFVQGFQPISTGYVPRRLQAELHAKLRRFNVLVMHRRFGKTVFTTNEKLDRALRNPLKRPQYAYIAPTFGQAKRVAWDYFKDFWLKIPGSEPNEAELRIDIPRPDKGDFIRAMLLGAENPKTVKGLYLDGVTLDEYAEMNPSIWSEVVRPLLSDRHTEAFERFGITDNGWANFIGTPKGRNNLYELREYALHENDPEWFTALYRASETGIIPQKELDSARKQMTEEEYLQEYECDFSAGLVGAYFSKELAKAEREGRVTRVPHDPMMPVDLYFDLGFNDVTSVWYVQSSRNRHRVINYFEVCGAGIDSVVKLVRERDPSYNFGTWVYPHDVEQHDYSTGRTRLAAFEGLGCRPYEVVPRVQVKMDSINAARMIFGACEFDAINCKLGLKGLAEYQRKWNTKNEVFEESPLHNWASNAADAFQQFAMAARPDTRSVFGGRYSDSGSQIEAVTAYDRYTLEER